jgi:two-component system, OmpR family, response regulator VicR
MTKSILIIEDEHVIGDALSERLKSEGYNVTWETDATVGIEKALSQKPNLIILDLVLPGKDGVSFLNDLRADDAYGASANVLILTNLSSESALEIAKSHGVKHYLIKTNWRLTEVVARVHEIIG